MGSNLRSFLLGTATPQVDNFYLLGGPPARLNPLSVFTRGISKKDVPTFFAHYFCSGVEGLMLKQSRYFDSPGAAATHDPE